MGRFAQSASTPPVKSRRREKMNPDDESCPVPGCGKKGPGSVVDNVLDMKCPVHGQVFYNYETENLQRQ